MVFLHGAPFKFATKLGGLHKGYVYGVGKLYFYFYGKSLEVSQKPAYVIVLGAWLFGFSSHLLNLND